MYGIPTHYVFIYIPMYPGKLRVLMINFGIEVLSQKHALGLLKVPTHFDSNHKSVITSHNNHFILLCLRIYCIAHIHMYMHTNERGAYIARNWKSTMKERIESESYLHFLFRIFCDSHNVHACITFPYFSRFTSSAAVD